MAEAAGRHLDAGHLDVGVHAEQGFEGVEGVDEAVVHEARLGQHCAERRVGVALGEHEAVAVGPVRLVGPEPEIVEIERGQQVGRGKRTAHVAGTRRAQRPPRVAPDLQRLPAQLAQQRLPVVHLTGLPASDSRSGAV